MPILVSNTLKVLLVGFIVGLLGSAIWGVVLGSSFVVNKFHFVFLVAGAAPGSSNGSTVAQRSYFAFVGAIGSALGWVMYRGIIL